MRTHSSFLPALVVFILSALAVVSVARAAVPLPAPKVLAVYAYADWCTNCKLLSPKLEAAKADPALAGKQVLFVTLDLTDKTHIQQSVLLASALGIAPWFQPQGSATGYVAVLDATTKKELARFDRDSSTEEMVKALAK